MLVIWTQDKAVDLTAIWRNVLSVNKIPHRFVNALNIPELDKGDLLFVMGSKNMELLAKQGIIPKNKSTTWLRNKTWPMPNGALAMFSYSVGVQSSDWSMYQNMLIDCRMAVRYMMTGTSVPKIGKYRWVTDFTDVIDYVKEQYAKTGKPVPITGDLETLGLDRYNPESWIISIFITAQRRTAAGMYFNKGEIPSPEEMAQIVWLLNTPMVSTRGANFKYDLNWMVEKWGIRCTNFKMDTLLVGSILDENRSNSLNTHAKLYTPFGGYDDYLNEKYDKGRMDLVPLHDLLPYAGGDTDACMEVSLEMIDLLKQQPALAKFYTKVLHPAARAYEKVEQEGVLVNVPVLLALEEELTTYLAELRQKARKIVGNRLYYKHLSDDKEFNLTKASFLTDYFFSPNGLNLTPRMVTEKSDPEDPTPATALDHLMMFRDVPEAKDMVALLKEYSSASKILSTYVCKRDSEGTITGGFLKHLRPDSKFHPTYFLYAGDKDNKNDGGTVTGRLSVKDPAYQTLVKHGKWAKKLRSAYPAKKGYIIMGRDYSQGELKIAACLADEPTMLGAYLAGIDLHAVTGATMGGYSLDEFMGLKVSNAEVFDALRQLAKAGNFGLLYGMGVEGFIAYAYASFGVVLSYAEAEASRNKFFSTYIGLVDWHRQAKAYAKKHKQIVSPLGRVRHLPLIDSYNGSVRSGAERQALNSPVQSTLSDMSLWSTALWDAEGYMESAPIIGMVHDALYFLVPEDNIEFYWKKSGEIMENLPFHELGWKPQLQFTSDAEFGYNLGDMAKVKNGVLPDFAALKQTALLLPSEYLDLA